jgi:hypothetical protein
MGWRCRSNGEEWEKCVQKFSGEICTKVLILKTKDMVITWRRILEKAALKMEDKATKFFFLSEVGCEDEKFMLMAQNCVQWWTNLSVS